MIDIEQLLAPFFQFRGMRNELQPFELAVSWNIAIVPSTESAYYRRLIASSPGMPP